MKARVLRSIHTAMQSKSFAEEPPELFELLTEPERISSLEGSQKYCQS